MGVIAVTSRLLSKRKKRKVAQRMGGMIRLTPGKYEEYKRLHAAVWPSVLQRLYDSNIRNYTIYHRDGILFSHFEYIGTDFEADSAKISADPQTRKWWEVGELLERVPLLHRNDLILVQVCEPCQQPLNWSGPPPSQGGTGPGQWWASMEELFHDGHPATEYL